MYHVSLSGRAAPFLGQGLYLWAHGKLFDSLRKRLKSNLASLLPFIDSFNEKTSVRASTSQLPSINLRK